MIRRYTFLLLGMILLAVLFRMGVSGDLGQDSSLKTMITPLAALYLNTFNSPTTAMTLCLAMVIAGAGLFLYYWLGRTAPAIRDLKQVADELRRIGEPGSRAALEGTDQVMSRHAIVARGWQLYRATLVARSGNRVAAQVQPERYFDMRMLEGAGVRLRFFLGLPNDFVGLGLIFTFMGLVAGLYFASRSMMSADLGVAREALVQLLHAATFKFLTSITGIGLSLVLGWSQRVLMDGLRGQLAEIQFLLEERFPLSPAGETPVGLAPTAVTRAGERSARVQAAEA